MDKWLIIIPMITGISSSILTYYIVKYLKWQDERVKRFFDFFHSISEKRKIMKLGVEIEKKEIEQIYIQYYKTQLTSRIDIKRKQALLAIFQYPNSIKFPILFKHFCSENNLVLKKYTLMELVQILNKHDECIEYI